MVSSQLLIAYSATISDYFAIIPFFIRKKLMKKNYSRIKDKETPEIDDKVNEYKGQN